MLMNQAPSSVAGSSGGAVRPLEEAAGGCREDFRRRCQQCSTFFPSLNEVEECVGLLVRSDGSTNAGGNGATGSGHARRGGVDSQGPLFPFALLAERKPSCERGDKIVSGRKLFAAALFPQRFLSSESGENRQR